MMPSSFAPSLFSADTQARTDPGSANSHVERDHDTRHAPERADHLLFAAPSSEHARPALRQHAHGFATDAGRAAGDQEVLALEREALGHDLGRRAVAIAAGSIAFE